MEDRIKSLEARVLFLEKTLCDLTTFLAKKEESELELKTKLIKYFGSLDEES
jgi:uncharacterized coiled-coil protein SlyX